MPKYIITWEEKVTETWEAKIEAETAEKAKQMLKDNCDNALSNAQVVSSFTEETLINMREGD